tara:strand:- start:2911 stop:3207 length:297 start_codon:yes stop_codon:yes gene_type:complete
MKKRFVVALDSNTKKQNDEFKEYIEEHGFAWWYWIDGFWLLVDSSGKLTASKLRTDLGEIYPGVHMLVLELQGDDDTWSGFGPNTENRNMFSWLERNW